jgi:hypothetical protein
VGADAKTKPAICGQIPWARHGGLLQWLLLGAAGLGS